MNRRRPDNLLWLFSLILMCLIGVGLIGLLLFAPGRVLARLAGEQQVALHSPLKANYSQDPLSIMFAPLDMRVVEEALKAEITSTQGVDQQVATAIGALKSPVPTITPYRYFTPTRYPTSALQKSPTKVPGASQTPQSLFTPTENGLAGTMTLTPLGTVRSKTPTATKAPSLTPSPFPTLIIATTGVPRTPTGTPSLTPTPTKTLGPTTAASWTPTNKPTLTPTPTSTKTLAPTKTYTTVPTATPTATTVPTRTPTATTVPTRTPTRTSTPIPYPPPATSTPVTATTPPPGTPYP